ncbi:MAG: elongation factor G [Gammaproteobacteria bacterium]|nr:elongation factor G [Gammaproteobacteria bacterium]
MDIRRLRNIGIIAHVDAGKTTLTERILYFAGASHKLGEVHHGTTTTDFDPEERKRGITIYSAATSVYWQEHRITIIDTPGHIDFNVEVNRALRVLDGAVVVFDGVAGVEPQSETNWRLADQYGVPRLCYVNKLDRAGADFYRVVNMIEERLATKALVLQLPIGSEEAFVGIVDLVNMRAVYWDTDPKGVQYRSAEIPAQMQANAQHYRELLLDKVLDQDDVALSAYLRGVIPEPQVITQCIRQVTLNRKFVPVLCGSAYKNKAVQPLLDAVVAYLPSPMEVSAVKCVVAAGEAAVTRHNDVAEPFAALAFKVVNDKFGALTFLRAYSGHILAGTSVVNTVTGRKERISRIYEMQADKRLEREAISAGDIVAVVGLKYTVTGDTLSDPDAPVVLERMVFPEPVIDVALEPKTKSDEDKLLQSLHQLVKEDPSLAIKVNQETGQTILSGMGELHLEVKINRLLNDFGVTANVGAPQVAYRETISRPCELTYRVKKQGGGPGTFAVVTMRFEPLPRGVGIEFINNVVGGEIPKEYIPGVEKGIRAAARSGVIAGYPCVDFRATLLGGDYHEVDSSTFAFELAAQGAYRQGMQQSHPILLEPVMRVVVNTPSDYLGDCIGDLNRRRGKIIGQDGYETWISVQAHVPLAEMFGYIGNLRSLSSGRANFTMQFEHYDKVPANIVENIKK